MKEEVWYRSNSGSLFSNKDDCELEEMRCNIPDDVIMFDSKYRRIRSVDDFVKVFYVYIGSKKSFSWFVTNCNYYGVSVPYHDSNEDVGIWYYDSRTEKWVNLETERLEFITKYQNICKLFEDRL